MKKFITQMIYGIQACQDIKLSNISRSLKEAIPLIKTEDRLSRNLSSMDFSGKINYEVTRLAGITELLKRSTRGIFYFENKKQKDFQLSFSFG